MVYGIWLLSKIRISASRLIFCLVVASFNEHYLDMVASVQSKSNHSTL